MARKQVFAQLAKRPRREPQQLADPPQREKADLALARKLAVGEQAKLQHLQLLGGEPLRAVALAPSEHIAFLVELTAPDRGPYRCLDLRQAAGVADSLGDAVARHDP